MFAKTITYTDYNDEERTETFYFNLSKAELVEMNLSVYGGLEQLLRKIISEKDTVKIAETFKELILKCYGEKSPDGKRFVKNEELRTNFEQTEAYSQLYVELIANTDAAIEFCKGILPKDLSEKLDDETLKTITSEVA